ncbi:LysR family transcriptional regulator [Cytobacillus firmus]|uniref:LysR family transcriptional regulator n=2 Tax=Cytobacillus TaxID=2675230 RepID=A0A366K3W4_CYTFI|nr:MULTISPECIES: LysR family transcriptional regulator [Cytobacillus]RBP95848.1 LysR family transcriptional regulator [Cytobacillus firmus]TDX44761.1 LysR family transcriptional regulator [Cytobacillus oceanisediminis]
MNIASLRMFCRVVDEGSMSKAARLSFVSQPAVTKQIRQLENRYGTLLFDRMDGKMTLSKAGEVLYSYAKDIIEADNTSFQAIQEILGEHEHKIQVGASPTIGEYLLPGMLGAFKKHHQEMNFRLWVGNTPYILSKLEENEIDIALVESGVKDPNYKVQKFAEDDLILVTSHHHRWKGKEFIEVDELKEEKIIWREKNSGTRELVELALREYMMLEQMDYAMELGSIQSIKSAVEAELGISILPRITVLKELKYNILREVKIKDFSIKRALWIVQKKRRFKKSAEIYFEQFLQSRI